MYNEPVGLVSRSNRVYTQLNFGCIHTTFSSLGMENTSKGQVSSILVYQRWKFFKPWRKYLILNSRLLLIYTRILAGCYRTVRHGKNYGWRQKSVVPKDLVQVSIALALVISFTPSGEHGVALNDSSAVGGTVTYIWNYHFLQSVCQPPLAMQHWNLHESELLLANKLMNIKYQPPFGESIEFWWPSLW